MSDSHSNVPQDLPVSNAERVAHMFMMEGRSNAPTGDYSDSFDICVCDPQNEQKAGQFDLKGGTKSGPQGEYDYDMKPMRLSAGSLAGQNPIQDAQGNGAKVSSVSHIKKG